MVFATRHQYLNQYLNQIMGLRDRCDWILSFLIFCVLEPRSSVSCFYLFKKEIIKIPLYFYFLFLKSFRADSFRADRGGLRRTEGGVVVETA